MPRPADSRHREAVAPLAEFCRAHGYQWRWRLTRDEQWHGEVKIIDPAAPPLEQVVAWYGATSNEEMTALASAVRYAVEKAQAGLDLVERQRAFVAGEGG